MDDKRLIDAEMLEKNIAQIAKACAKSDKQKALIGRILFMIENMPTIEAEPVKHGRWIPHTKQIVDIDIKLPTECSECGFEEFSAEKYNFCPNCGSKNRIGGDTNE